MEKNKKGDIGMFGILGGFVLVFIVVYIGASLTINGIPGVLAPLRSAEKSLDDPDFDKIATLQDKCPCVEGDFESSEKGCPLRFTDADKKDRRCLTTPPQSTRTT